jgi:phage portal protein BeeE
LPAETKQAEYPLLWPSYAEGQAVWHIADYRSYVEQGFNLNTLIYSAIMYKVRAATAAPMRAWEGDVDSPDRVELDEPLAQLLSRPNPHQSWIEFHGLNITYINLSGNNYTLLIRDNSEEVPEAMISLRPDRVFVVPGRDEQGNPFLKGYLYVLEGRSTFLTWPRQERMDALREGRAFPILPENMIHTKFPNPGDQLGGLGEGLSPLSALAQSADVDNAVTHYLQLFFQRGSVIPGLLSFETRMNEDDIGRIRELWMERYGNYENWADIGVLGQGGKYQRIGMNFEEMSFEGIDERNESRILAPFGVPGVLLGTRLGLNRATMANSKDLRRQFWEDTLMPENRLFEVDYQFYLRDDDQFPAFDYSKVPALQQDVPSLVEAANKLWSMGVPSNQAIRAVGLGGSVGDVPGGDTGYVNGGLVFSGVTTEEEEITAEGASEAAEPRKLFDQFGTLYKLARDNEGSYLGNIAAERLVDHLAPVKKKD